MRRDGIHWRRAAALLGTVALGATITAHAAMFDMMNPSKWFGSDRDRYGYGYSPYGWGGPYGGHGGPWGWGGPYGGYGGPWGWGGPYGGYGPHGYGGPWGWGGHPGGYGHGSTIVVNPPSNTTGGERPAQVTPKLPE